MLTIMQSVFKESKLGNLNISRMISSTVHKAKLKSASSDMIKTGINDLLLQKVTKLKEDQQLEKAQTTFAKIQQPLLQMRQYQLEHCTTTCNLLVMSQYHQVIIYNIQKFNNVNNCKMSQQEETGSQIFDLYNGN
ncbi:Hypothetical_protein [Hexamita inflata]|uniref:Hypothetical_protein n=1 Tax=Hexamita inflata TaxID=28002 RepID=A0AA86PUE6_9EUKA|nr:Hypothetical protein HINF_LOCUS29260 [Hexamita inflata]